MAKAPFEDLIRAEEQDFESELRLRSIAPPYDAVAAEAEAFFATVARAGAELRADPGRLAEVDRDLSIDIYAFKAKRDRPKN